MKTSKPISTQGADHLQAGAVAYVAQAFEAVSAKRALQDVAIGGTVKQRAPLLQLADSVRRLLGVKLGHAPVVQELAATHGVFEVGLPIVCLVHVSHGRGDSTLRHYSVRLAEKRLGHHCHARALRQGLDGCAQARSSGPDDQYIMFVSFVFVGHRSRMSFIRPVATMRT
jgi:hypothetical protein